MTTMAKVNKISGGKVVRSDANALTDAVIKLLNLNDFHLFRVNTGLFKVGNRYIRSVPVGTPDILGHCPRGHFVSIEIKVGRDKLRTEQQAFIDRVGKTPDGRAVVIRNIEEAIAFLATFDKADAKISREQERIARIERAEEIGKRVARKINEADFNIFSP